MLGLPDGTGQHTSACEETLDGQLSGSPATEPEACSLQGQPCYHKEVPQYSKPAFAHIGLQLKAGYSSFRA